MPILARLIETKSDADLVLSCCSAETVDCWTMPNHAGVRLALFLQFHTADGAGLPADAARVRFAYRNFYPQTFVFERVFVSVGGTMGAYSRNEPQTIAAIREDGAYRQRVLPEAVPVQRGDDGAAITANIGLIEPPALTHITDTLSVDFASQTPQRCACCSRSFPS